jgi:hypothetical protein
MLARDESVAAQDPTGILGLRGVEKNRRRDAGTTNTIASTLWNIAENDYYPRESEFAELVRVR